MNHKDVVALVTGGASGLGEASIMELVKKGAKAVIVDFDSDKGEKLATDIGADAIFIKTDVTSDLMSGIPYKKPLILSEK